MTIDLQEAVTLLISSATVQKTKIEKLERDVAMAFRMIEELRRSVQASSLPDDR